MRIIYKYLQNYRDRKILSISDTFNLLNDANVIGALHTGQILLVSNHCFMQSR